MHYDADAYVAALTPPSLTLGGVTYTGRHLSAAQWVRALTLLDEARVKGSATAWVRVAAFVFRAMFDPPRWQVWRRWPSRAILAAPPAVWQDALATFFASSETGRLQTTATTPPPGLTMTSLDATALTGAATSPDSSAPTASTPGTPPATGQPETA